MAIAGEIGALTVGLFEIVTALSKKNCRRLYGNHSTESFGRDLGTLVNSRFTTDRI
ncbi:hypothetical protein [Chamaesiphon sp. VAR_48_metabat_403]|uniref:hypothetical protein n=1 Tax=Chamaesiphon sp. VAR_48_metabat_403 TaxID=2964700 RepID=UPI00286E8305|nr:hypothetical protein [Chamaesiphon sp. VAR_48_metabat_403]